VAKKDWQRFLAYASRVVNLATDVFECVSPSAFHILSLSKPATVKLFPKLRILDCRSVYDGEFFHVQHLLGPAIVDFDFSVRDGDIFSMSLLHTLQELCPSIKKLVIRNFTAAVMEDVSTHICSWETLEEVSVSRLNDSALTHLASMRTLRSLSFLAMDPIFTSSPPRGPAFPVLQTLSFEADDASALPRVLSFSTKCPINDLSFEVNQPSSTDSWRECFQALQKHISHNTLKSLQFGEIGEEQADATRAIPGTLLMSLHVFSNLTKFTLRLSSPLEFDDTTLKSMAIAWPSLRELCLGTDRALGGLSNVTLAGLIPLVQYCRDLSILEVVVNATNTTALSQSKPGAGISNTLMTSLNFGDSRISPDVSNIAAFLSDIFPNVTSILYDVDQQIEEFDDRWEQVERLIPVFAKVRLQERLFAGSQSC
jgi:hypothetical protein